jgi:hypothetical protein
MEASTSSITASSTAADTVTGADTGADTEEEAVTGAVVALGFLTFSAATFTGTSDTTAGTSTASEVLDLLILGILLYYTIGKSF